jgi:hypothetical protein
MLEMIAAEWLPREPVTQTLGWSFSSLLFMQRINRPETYPYVNKVGGKGDRGCTSPWDCLRTEPFFQS